MYNALSSVIGGGRGAHASAGTPRPARRGPSRRRVRTASAVLKNLVRQPEKTFSTVAGNSGLILAPIGRGRQRRRPKHSPQTGRSRLSEAETQPDRGIDVAVLEKAEAQPAMHLVEHHAKIEIPLWRKSPIHRGRNRIVRPGALRVRAVGAEGAPSSGGAEKGILDVMVICADHIQVIRDGVFRTGPHDLQDPVTKAVHTEGGIVDIRVVERCTTQTKKASRDIGKSGLRIAGRHKSKMFVTGVYLQRSIRVFGDKHHGFIVGDRRRERLWQERGYRHPKGVIASRRKCARHGISETAVDCVDRELTFAPR